MEALVTISQGQLLGNSVTTLSGIQYNSFQGIPYAEPPIGGLRFKEPVPPKPWSGVKSARKEGNKCSQIDTLLPNADYSGNEDCLYLNVYTPSVLKNITALLPVMFYIHGGGFSGGSGSSETYGPDYFMEEDVVLVTINYRLGVLGFLNLGTAGVSGNAGLKDMTMALVWVRENIQNFGGDPDNVTIFGESAGGAAVQGLALSGSSNSLFRKAISQSGSISNQWAHTRKGVDPVERAKNVASTLSKEKTELSAEDALEILQKANVEDLVSAALKSRTEEEVLRDSSFPFAPVLEGDSFFGHPIRELFDGDRFLKIPFLQGFNDKEGMLYFLNAMSDSSRKKYNENFELFVPYDMGLEIGSDGSKRAAAEIKEFYFGKESLSNETLDNYFDLMTDAAFLHKIIENVKANAGKRVQYFYRFSFDGDLNYLKKYLKLSFKGTCHEDDLGYLFSMRKGIVETGQNSDSDIMRKRMLKMWTNFAKYGNPVPKTDDLLTTKWEKVTSASDLQYLRIEKNMKMDTNPENDRIVFWDNLYKKYVK